ncbi:FecR family protein [Methylovorus menthalis]|uniref:FecR family protein n=1 Tax=Methylovorus menthalis TaxID=1002227 RepID=UPI001E3A2ADC|nr:FecR family protein [Methylovorus menthalis]MCB4810311.1 FecR family protein [Methylovorus menthalis]
MPEVRQQAAEWLIQLTEADTEAQRIQLQAACQAWQQRHPRHAEIFRQMETLWQSLADHAGTAKPKRGKGGRKVLIGSALSALLLLGGLQLPTTRYWLADERTSTGEIRQISLSDGSRITLNTHSAVDIRFDAHTRTIRLTEGEVLAEVAHDPQQRPFIVENRDGTATALGTRYLVRQDVDSSTVTVLESTVAVKPLHSATISKVYAGEQLRFDAQQAYTLMPAPALADSWHMQRLVFEDAPLSAVIARLAEYRPGLLKLRTDTRPLRFTGVLPTDDGDKALSILQQALPIRIQRYSNFVVLVDTAGADARQPAPDQ